MTEENEELTPLELEFKQAAEKVLPLIDKQIDIARAAIEKAVALSEEYGVPFDSDITPLSMPYRPTSFYSKFGDVDRHDLYKLIGIPLPEYEGWQTSSVCW